MLFRLLFGPAKSALPESWFSAPCNMKLPDGCATITFEIPEQPEKLDLAPEMYELIETTIFGGSVQIRWTARDELLSSPGS